MSQPSVRAKFHCQSVEMFRTEPYEVQYGTATEMTWPRTYRFMPVYDTSVPEDQRYARYTPSGELRIQVDNPAVAFEPGRYYYLDLTPVDEG